MLWQKGWLSRQKGKQSINLVPWLVKMLGIGVFSASPAEVWLQGDPAFPLQHEKVSGSNTLPVLAKYLPWSNKENTDTGVWSNSALSSSVCSTDQILFARERGGVLSVILVLQQKADVTRLMPTAPTAAPSAQKGKSSSMNTHLGLNTQVNSVGFSCQHLQKDPVFPGKKECAPGE